MVSDRRSKPREKGSFLFHRILSPTREIQMLAGLGYVLLGRGESPFALVVLFEITLRPTIAKPAVLEGPP
jgi:hypothetical protein